MQRAIDPVRSVQDQLHLIASTHSDGVDADVVGIFGGVIEIVEDHDGGASTFGGINCLRAASAVHVS
jgi:hypothetical protein